MNANIIFSIESHISLIFFNMIRNLLKRIKINRKYSNITATTTQKKKQKGIQDIISVISIMSENSCERHHQKLGFVCVQADCIERGLICSTCARGQHSTHGIMAVSTFVDAYLESSELSNNVGELRKQWRGMKNNGVEIAQQFDSLSKQLSEQLACARDSIIANLQCDIDWIERILERE